MAVSVYSNEGILTKIRGAIGDLYRSFFKRLTPETLIAITDSLVTLVRFPANLYVDPHEQYMRWLGRKLRKASPIYVVSMMMPFLSIVRDLEWRKLDTFDYLSPKFASRHTYQEVIRWFMDARFTNITKLPVPVSVKGTLTKRYGTLISTMIHWMRQSRYDMNRNCSDLIFRKGNNLSFKVCCKQKQR